MELVVVMTLIGIVTALTLPKFDMWFGLREDFGNAFLRSLKAAHALALSQNREVFFEIDGATRTYGIRGGRRYPIGGDVQIWAEDGRPMDRLYVICFFPDGSATPAKLTLIQGDRSYVVTIDPVLGRVRFAKR